jgi:hypothetical protein
MLEEKNDNLQKADGYVVSNSTESIQVETTTPKPQQFLMLRKII